MSTIVDDAVIELTPHQRTVIVAVCRRFGLASYECRLVLRDLTCYETRASTAEALNLTEGTVSAYRRSIFRKFGLASRYELTQRLVTFVLTGDLPEEWQ